MSYGTKYKVPFKSISGTDYEILIDVQGYNGAITELIGGATPISIDTDTEDVLAPIRAGKATVSVYGSDYLQDLYTSNPQGIRVTLKKGTSIEWLGYITQDTFSQDFSKPEFIYDMECVSALNTLKYKKFAETGSKITFLQLIKNAALLAGYTELYLTTAITDASSGNVYANSSVAVANFYDELDEPMNYFEILEEVAKYLVCCTFVPYKNALYLLDYKAIRNGLNQYYKYNPATTDAPLTVTLSHVVSTQDLGYTGTGATLSRIAGKNKATVNCSLYEQDNILPEFNNEGSEFVRTDEVMETYTEGKETVVKYGFIRHYNHPKYTFYKYMFTGGNVAVNMNSDALGATEIGTGFVRTAEYDAKTLPNKLNFTDEVLVRMLNYSDITKRIPESTGKLISIKSEKSIYFTPGSYFCLSFAMKFIGDLPAETFGRDAFQPRTLNIYKFRDTGEMNVKCMLKTDNYIYNGTTWVALVGNEGVTFNVPIPVTKDEPITGAYLNVKNTNRFNLGLPDMTGLLINPMPVTTAEKIELTIMMPQYDGTLTGAMENFGYFYIKDIKLETGTADTQNIYDDWVKGNDKKDVVYENQISDDYVEEADEINLKLCTKQPGTKLSLSSVINTTSYNVDGYQVLIYSWSMNVSAQPENLILQKVVSIFSKPRYVINPTVKNGLKPYSLVTDGGLTGVTFVNCGGSEDVLMESSETNLIEI